jgi:hypothetical protein
MKAYILAGLVSLFGLASIAADPLPSDEVIQQRIVGTWRMNWMVLNITTTIATNGDYVAYYQSAPSWTNTDRLEGTIKIRDGLMIDTQKKSSTTNQPVPVVSTNVIIQVTDHELIFRAPKMSPHSIMWERVKP